LPAPVISFRREAILAEPERFHAESRDATLPGDDARQREWAERLAAYAVHTQEAENPSGVFGAGLDTALGLAGFVVAIADVSGPLSALGLILGFLGFASSAGKQIDANLRAAEMLALQKQIEEAQINLLALRAAPNKS